MKVTVTIDEQDVAEELVTKTSVEYEPASGYVEGDLQEIIDAVIASVGFEFDRSDVELAAILQFPELNR